MNPRTRKLNNATKPTSRYYAVSSYGASYDDDPDETGPLTTEIDVTPNATNDGFYWEGSSWPGGKLDDDGAVRAAEHAYTHTFTREQITAVRDMLTELLLRTHP